MPRHTGAFRPQPLPHETTFDQFFDEAQWESYPRLGQHIVSRVLTPSLFDHLTRV